MAKDLARNPAGAELEGTRTAREIAPLVDIYENDQELLIVADVPGVEKDGLSVQLDPPELRLEGRRGDSERYVRAFRVSEVIDPEGISADLSNGVLQVHLKKSQAAQPRKIPVRTA
jgi:HSP20 family molecular chaperone IbpA